MKKNIIILILVFSSMNLLAQYQEPREEVREEPAFGALTIKSSYGCPFKDSTSEDVKEMWKRTSDTVETLAKQESCISVQAAASQLQKSIANLKIKDGEYTFDNYKPLIEADCDAAISLIARELHLSGGTYSNCDDSDKDLSAKAVRDSIIECMIKKKEVLLVETKNQLELQKQKQNIKLKTDDLKENLFNNFATLSSNINTLIKSAEKCNNQDVAMAATSAGISVLGSVASAYAGPFGAFAADILNSIVELLFNLKSKQSLKFIEAENDHAKLACLFYESQVMRCEDLPVSEISCNQTKSNGNIELLAKTIRQIILPQDKASIEFTQSLKKTIPELKNRSILSVFKDEVIPTLEDDLSNSQEDIDNIKRYYNALNTYEEKYNSYKSETNEEAKKAKRKDVTALEKTIKENSLFSIFGKYQESLDVNNKNNTKNELYQALTTIFKVSFKKERNETKDGDIRAKSHITSLLVTNLKPIFEKRLKAHHENDFKTARKFSDRKKSFAHLDGIINDCILTSGIHHMGTTNLNQNESSVTKIIAKPEKYLKYCQKFICDNGGIPSFKSNLGNDAEDFERYQCGTLYNYHRIKSNIKNNFIEKGTVCGKSLDAFFSQE